MVLAWKPWPAFSAIRVSEVVVVGSLSLEICLRLASGMQVREVLEGDGTRY